MADGTITGVTPGIGIAGGGESGQVEVSLDPTGSVTFSGASLARQTDPPTGARTIQIPNCRWVMNQLDAHSPDSGGGTENALPLLGGTLVNRANGGLGLTINNSLESRDLYGHEAALMIEAANEGMGVSINNIGWIGISVRNLSGRGDINPNGVYIDNNPWYGTGLNIHNRSRRDEPNSGLFVHDYCGFGVHVFHYYDAMYGGIYCRNYSTSPGTVVWSQPASTAACFSAANEGPGPCYSSHINDLTAQHVRFRTQGVEVFTIQSNGAITLSEAGIASLKAQLGIS